MNIAVAAAVTELFVTSTELQVRRLLFWHNDAG